MTVPNESPRYAAILEARLTLIERLIIANEEPARVAQEARALLQHHVEMPTVGLDYNVRRNCWVAWSMFVKRVGTYWLEPALTAHMHEAFFEEVDADEERVAQDGAREISR
jgi:hypothetical protein